jgi:hypothetical protein
LFTLRLAKLHRHAYGSEHLMCSFNSRLFTIQKKKKRERERKREEKNTKGKGNKEEEEEEEVEDKKKKGRQCFKIPTRRA